MQIATLQCKAGAQFHFGKLGFEENMSLDDTSDFIHSDTLFSALVNEHFHLFGESQKTTEFVNAFKENQISISSGFYSLALVSAERSPSTERQILFFPVPAHFTFLVTDEKVLKNIKQLKKIKFVSQSILEEGILPDEWFSKQFVIIQDKFVCKKEEIQNFAFAEKWEEPTVYEHHNETKVRVHSTTKEGVLYNQVNVQIADNGIKDLQINYFFLFAADNKGLESELKQVIHSLEFSGIGGQRSTGSGQFEGVEIRDFGFKEQNEAVQMSLSLIIPENKTLNNFKYFDFIERGGRRIGFNNPDEGSGYYLNRIKMIQEGAILNSENESGLIEDIKPKNEKGVFLRSGKAFLMPIHKNFHYNE